MASVFVHFEEGDDAFTAKIKTSVRMEEVVYEFNAKYKAKTGCSLQDKEKLCLYNGNQRLKAEDWSRLANRTDIFLVREKQNDILEKGKAALSEKRLTAAKICFESLTKNTEAIRLLAETYLLAGKPEKALATALRLTEKDSLHLFLLARCESAAKNHDTCRSYCQDALACLKAKHGPLFEDATILLAWTLIEDGVPGDAIELVEAVLAKNEEHLDALRCYARIARLAKKPDEEISLLLRAVVQASTKPNQNDRLIRYDLAQALEFRQDALKRLESILDASNAQAASAYAFLATIAKDHGATHAALKLLEKASALRPHFPAYALNLLHAFEIVARSNDSIRIGLECLRAHTETRIGPLALTQFFACLQAPTDQDTPLVWLDNYAHLSTSAHSIEDARLYSYNENELDVIAIIFALIKLYFLAGNISLAKKLVALVEPLRRASRTPFHETTIRNEHAYYACVAQLLCLDPDRSCHRDPSTSLDIHLIGDSHTLSPAWKHFALSEKKVLLVPHLVTGLKHWHLRSECSFYPKRNFYAMLNLDHTKQNSLATSLGIPQDASMNAMPPFDPDIVPKNAVVLFILGEIDCREGILMAVQKLRYESIQHGINHTAQLFIDAANALVVHKGYKAAFVHPIPPVLDETRTMVIQYNLTLKSLVEKSPHLIWLDFFGGLLKNSKPLSLKSQYKLDGTHLHPQYIEDLLIPCLRTHLTRLNL